MNRADEVLMALPSDTAAKLWGVDKAPTNVLIETEDGRTFIVFISEAKGKFFLFNGWSDVVTHLGLKTGCLVILNPLDSTRFKLTYFVNGVSPTCFWTSMVPTASHFSADIAPIDSVQDVAPLGVAEQPNGHIIRFVRMAAHYFWLPDNVSSMAKLDLGLKSITIRLLHLNPQKEYPNGTRREKKVKGYRYALRRWSRFMNIACIKVGDTVYFCFDETDQVLSVERVVPHVIRR
ncbi:putative transcription factor B3-Domain family [Helianthus debilis subsp. tardiflorus]